MELYAKVMGKGAPLIIMHGVFGSSDNWATLGRRWSEKYEVHLLDMRNHGKSPHSENFSYEIMVEDVVGYLESKNIEKAFVLGHSMGGKVAMLMAVLYPEKVKKLIVADIAPKPYAPHHQKILEALESLDLESISSRSEAEENFSSEIDDISTRQFLLKNLYWKKPKQLAWRFNVAVIAREIMKVGEGLPSHAFYFGETLFIKGGNSWYIQDEDEDMILEHFPNAEIVCIDGAGHWLHAEKPVVFFEEVSNFLA